MAIQESVQKRTRLPEDKFVGRTHESELLSVRINRAIAGEGSICFVIGEAGVGKTRLVTESLERLSGEGIAVLQAHCDGNGLDRSFSVFVDLLRECLKRFGADYVGKTAGDQASRLAKIEPDAWRQPEGLFPTIDRAFRELGQCEAADESCVTIITNVDAPRLDNH